MESKKISVIIPVYNVELYIEQCLKSVISQSYENLEIILIDDGSTDSSGKICDVYAEKDKRVTVIHQKNTGAAGAKNAGLRVASGQYLSFVDSDDYLEPDAYEYMVNQLITSKADIIQCGFYDLYKNERSIQIGCNEQKFFNTQEYLKRFTEDWTCGLLWDKLYVRSLFKDIYFEEGHKIDDEFFTYRGVMNASKIIYVPQAIYNYRKRRSGVMLSEESQKKILMDRLQYLAKRRIDVNEKFPELKSAFDYHFLNMMVILSKDPCSTEESIKMIQNALASYFAKEKVCKMEISLRFQLFKLRYSSIKRILSKISSESIETEKDVDKYFE